MRCDLRIWFFGVAVLWVLAVAPSLAEVPYPLCQDVGCADPSDFSSYLFIPDGGFPNDLDPNAGSSWKYNPGSGMDVPGAWAITTGRPDVVVAVLDSGIEWDEADLAAKVALNIGELPPPAGCQEHDCNGDGFVSVADYAGLPDANQNGLLDGQDLILAFSDGTDDDANGFVDDIAGWDFADDDNDPSDLVRYGHGTGQAEDSTAEANNGRGMPGVAPNAMFLPLKVADSFVAVGSDFAQAVVYAVDVGADVVQEALGTISAGPTSQAAINYAYARGVPVIASAADESSRHHNLPAALDHTVWMNSITESDGTLVEQSAVYDLFNGCTNYGGRAWTAISSDSCSSEATGRGAGLAALLVSHGKNLVDRGLLQNYPGLDQPFSAEEIRQLFRRSAEDVDHSGSTDDISILGLLGMVFSAPTLGLFFDTDRYPTQAGWDQYTGYGRAMAPALLDVRADAIPPEADLSGSMRWFDLLDPEATPRVVVSGSLAAVRASNQYTWKLEVGCGVQPATYRLLDEGREDRALEEAVLAEWDIAATAQACGFDPATPVDDPDDHTVTLRLQVRDGADNLGEDRRTVALNTDADLAWKLALGTSAEGAPALADMNRDGALDIVYGLSDGSVQVIDGATGESLPGFPAFTAPLPVHESPAYEEGEVPVPRESIVGPTASDDLDGDGFPEAVVGSMEGGLYVFEHDGRLRSGFPVRTDPALSDPANRDPLNDTDPAMIAAPTLVDLDPPGQDPGLEIVVPAWDGHVYAWRRDGSPVNGYPVRIADRSRVSIDPATGKASPIAAGVRERGAKLLGSVAAGDFDGDGRAEILVASNEEYENEPNLFAKESPLVVALGILSSQFGGFSFTVGGRLYAVHPDGQAAAGGPFFPGWPVKLPLISPGLLPTVGTGSPGAPAMADLDGSGSLSVAMFGAAGPPMLFTPAGQSALGDIGGVKRALAADFPSGFPNVPATAGSADAPFFGALGSGAFGDLDGDGLPEYAAPTAGIRKLLDLAGPGDQQFSDHQVTSWNPRDGAVLPAFPAKMDDTQFLTSPSMADVDGDGVAELLQGSGAYLVRAYRSDGSVPAGFPKFTHGWLITPPTAGDVDGDGLIEIVAATREGNLFVWDTPAPATESAIPWQGFGRDRRNTQNLASGVSPLAPPPIPSADPLSELIRNLEGVLAELEAGDCGYVCRFARRDLGRVLRAFEQGKLRRATSSFWRIHWALRWHDASLARRFASAIENGVDGLLEAAACERGDRRCQRRLRRAEVYDRYGDRHEAQGNTNYALRWWGRALVILAN